MNGGYIHESLLLERIERAFREQGFKAQRQVPTHKGRDTGYMDLVVTLESYRLAIEAEMSSRRIENDLQKAKDLNVTGLWIVVPNHRVACSVRRRLRNLNVKEIEPWLCILTLGQAMERVMNCFSLFSGSMLNGKTNNNGARSD